MRAVPITTLSRGFLFRAVVDLPAALCERERPLQARLVFFEHPSLTGAHAACCALLSQLWHIDVAELEQCVYNMDALGGALDELQALESGWGGDGPEAVGPDRIHYWRAADVDLLVSPRVATRLRELLAQVEQLYLAEPARRARVERAQQRSAFDNAWLRLGDQLDQMHVPAPVWRAHHDPVSRSLGGAA